MDCVPMFSIIVPIFNVEKYLETCISSITNQSFEDFELILVDDGSKDKCATICDDFQKNDKRIKVIHKKNGGLVSARKAGAQLANGRYVICVDGDDWIHKDCLKAISASVQKNHSDIICFGYYSYINENQVIEHKIPFKSGVYDRKAIENCIFPSLIQAGNASYFRPQVWGKAFARDIYIKNQLAVPDSLVLGEDGACVIPSIYQASSLEIIEESYYYYRFNDQSITRSGKKYKWSGPEIIYHHLENQIDLSQFDFQQQLYRKTVHELFNVILSRFSTLKSYKTDRKEILFQLSKPVYRDSIQNARFYGGLKAILMGYIIRMRWIWVLYVFHCFR